MVKYLLDSMIYDQLARDDECRELLLQRCKEGIVEILVTHIQFDQLRATPDSAKRDALLAVAMTIPSTKISTDGAVWGMSKWGEAKWGPGTGDVQIGDITRGNPRHNADGLLVATASSGADVFVTEETRLPNKVRRYNSKLKVMSFNEFRHILESPN
jgi:hypothetical protein